MMAAAAERIASTGISGLDEVLDGGLPRNRLFLAQGDPGAGKTTLGLQFLLEGVKCGERGLYITLSETKEELLGVADSHGWSLDHIALFELTPPERLTSDEENSLFHPADVELNETARLLLAEVERVRPTRVVFDSLSELRLLSQSALRYRRQVLSLKQFFIGRQCTVLLLDDRTSEAGDLQLQSLAHGVLLLEHLSPLYGASRRRLRVVKLRGVHFRGGYHDFEIRRGGIVAFPRLVAFEHRASYTREQQSTGLPSLDALFGGGLTRGSSTVFMGPTGTGKSTLALQCAVASAVRGENAAIFAFDENRDTVCGRAHDLGIPLQENIDNGRITLQQIDPAEMSPGEFASLVRRAVDERQVRVVVIDSLNGYIQAMPEESFLTLQLHEMLTFLGQHGVISILVMAQHGMLGPGMQSPVDVSYLADCVVMLRHFEAAGHIRHAISMLKKRGGIHEKTIREMRFGKNGLHIGAPLEAFKGILTGIPTYVGETAPLLTDEDA
ncbi:MAG: ATPase domain-containing protein [Deltaproteobacteria bacterium]|nr:ATPase domain-containing protein [Deltaproteobacteria bacterium]